MLAVAGDTETDATAIGDGTMTVNAEELVTPSLVALIVAFPAPTAWMSPLAWIVATALLEDCHATARPESTLPPASFRVAVACAVCPTEALVGLIETTTVATAACEGGATTSVAWPTTPSLVALTIAFPTVSAATTPESLTVAVEGFDVDHTNGRSLRTFPFASLEVAVARAV
jgi:hypothetical protein